MLSPMGPAVHVSTWKPISNAAVQCNAESCTALEDPRNNRDPIVDDPVSLPSPRRRHYQA